MSKKILALCAALAAVAAFAVAPAIASASPVLTYAAGGTVPTGKAVTGLSSNLKFTSGATTVECTNNTLGGTLLKNNGTEIEGTISTATFTNSSGGACATNKSGTTVKVTPEELPWCLKSISGKDEVEIIGGDCGTAKPIRFVLDALAFGVPVGNCTYESSQTGGGVLSTYETNKSPLVVTVASDTTFARKSCSNSTVEAEFGATGLLEGSFTLTSEGNALEVS